MDYVYAVFDSCSGVFGDPFVAYNDAVAKRLFDNAVANPSIPKYVRDDAVLYRIGEYNNKTGTLRSDTPAYVVSRGSSVVVPDVSHETSSDLEVIHNEE